MKNRQIYLTNIDANIILWKEILDPKNIAEKLNLSNLGQLTLVMIDEDDVGQLRQSYQ